MSILVRPYRLSDQEALTRMHRNQGFDYKAPEWSKLDASCVIERDGRPTMAAFLRKTAETLRKRDRVADLLILHQPDTLAKAAKRAGFGDVHCWLPPELEKDFGKVLLHLGWQHQLWPTYSREVK